MYDVRKALFSYALITNICALFVTNVILTLNMGYEGNPIMRWVLNNEVITAIFIGVMWSILYLILIKLPEKHPEFMKGSYISLAVIAIMASIDFWHDVVFFTST